MNPLMSLTLPHAEQPPLHDLERIGLQVDQDKQQPILRHGQRTVFVGGVPTGRARLSIETPCGHMGLECGLKRWHQLPKLVQRETRQIEYLCRMGLEIDEP